jgi:predicted methyltransferase
LLNGYALSLTHVLPRNAYYHNWQDLLTQTVCFSAECIRNTPEARWFNSSLVRLETLNGFRPKEIGKIRQSIFNDKEACGEIQ